jgi:hypothetical protein
MLAQRRNITGSGPMDIKFTNRLSYKQARLTVLVGFILGTLLSLIQIGIDYASEDASINREIQALLKSATTRLAHRLQHRHRTGPGTHRGLLQSPALIRARLIDNNDTVLADVERPGWKAATGPQRLPVRRAAPVQDRLYLAHMPGEYLGTLYLDVDTYAFGSRFPRPRRITLLNGFARSLVLTGILLALFYMMLTKPLVTVIGASAAATRAPRQTWNAPRATNTTRSACW